MIIGIDIDDTISNTYNVIMDYAQEYTAEVLKREPILKEDAECLNHMYTQSLHDWVEGEDIKFLRLYYERILKEVEPKTLAKKYLDKIHDEGNKIIIITARWKNDYFDVNKVTEDWLKKYEIPYDEIVTDASDKLKICKEKGIELFIDDSISNCNSVSEAGIKTFIMDAIVNRGHDNALVSRVYSWPHVYMKLKEEI